MPFLRWLFATQLIPAESPNDHVFPHLGDGGFDHVSDLYRIILDEGLFEQHHVFEPGFNLACCGVDGLT